MCRRFAQLGDREKPWELPVSGADRAGMTAIADLVTQGKLRPVIAGTYPLADAASAHAHGDTGHTAGKLVLTMR